MTTPGDPLVSVVVPCYQAERTIAGAVRSILAQSHRRIEVFVVDDGCTDASRAILATIDDPRLTVLSQTNGGAAAARNLALARCSGDYVAFLDADDRWLPQKLEAELAVLRAQSDPIGMAYSWYYAVDDRGRFLNESAAVDLSGRIFEELLTRESFLIPSVTLFHRAVFERIGRFDVDQYHEDFEFALRAARTFPVYPTRRRLVVYRQSMSGKCRSILSDFALAYREELSVVESVSPILTHAQLTTFRKNQMRSLFYRFLMYGFDRSARTLMPQIDTTELRGKKGLLASIYVRYGINVLAPIRKIVQSFNACVRQRSWQASLRRNGVRLMYD